MIIVKLMGGLGNQMFQYALGKALAAHHNTTFKLDLDFLLDRTPRPGFVFRDYDLDIFKLNVSFASKQEVARLLPRKPATAAGKFIYKIEKKIAGNHYYFEPHFHFDDAVFRLPSQCYLEGYWQSPLYFAQVQDALRNDFTFAEPMSPATGLLASQIRNNENSVCINVRRTDFLNSDFHCVCDMRYFSPAIECMASKIENPHFYIFSDDPEWCNQNFKLRYPVSFVSHQYKGIKFAHYLQLMSLCRHFIIPNSSFAWWATWLNSAKDKVVIAPKTWIGDPKWDSKDLIPSNWIRIENRFSALTP